MNLKHCIFFKNIIKIKYNYILQLVLYDGKTKLLVNGSIFFFKKIEHMKISF